MIATTGEVLDAVGDDGIEGGEGACRVEGVGAVEP